MEDFFAAGGMGAVLRELKPLLHLDCMTVTGETLGERLARRRRRLRRPHASSPRATSRSSRRAGSSRCSATSRPRAPSSSARPPTPTLFEHEGRAVVFSSLEDLAARIDDPALDVDAGRHPRAAERRPACARGMPEAGYLPIPKKLAPARRQGHGAHLRRAHERHRLRHHRAACDAGGGRPAGRSALVRNGDRIRLSVKERRIDLLVDEAELKQRAAAAQARARETRARLCQALCAGNPRRRRRLRFRVPAAACRCGVMR